MILRKKTFGSDDDLPLNKLLKLHDGTIVFRSVSEEDDKYYLQSFFRWMFVWVTKMMQYERTDILEKIDINKSEELKESIIFHYWYFNDIGYKFEL